MARDVGARSEQPCSSAAHRHSRIVRRGFSPSFWITRTASIIADDPVVLSVAPVAYG
jgi:hypothetical protein